MLKYKAGNLSTTLLKEALEDSLTDLEDTIREKYAQAKFINDSEAREFNKSLLLQIGVSISSNIKMRLAYNFPKVKALFSSYISNAETIIPLKFLRSCPIEQYEFCCQYILLHYAFSRKPPSSKDIEQSNNYFYARLQQEFAKCEYREQLLEKTKYIENFDEQYTRLKAQYPDVSDNGILELML